MARSRDSMSFAEWQQQNAYSLDQLSKSPARGGSQSPISPGADRNGPYYAPGNMSGSSRIGLPGPPAGSSQYTTERPDQPAPWINDVDDSNWWSPFQPIWPFGPPAISRPREWDYTVGYNLNYIQPQIALMQILRGMRSSWGVLATIIETRKDQLLRIPWTIQDKNKPGKSSPAVKQMQDFFRRPDGINSYSQWSRKLLDDLLVIDAPTIYLARNRGGKPMRAEILDGATIFPLIDDAGRRPEAPQPAFQQIIKGMPMTNYDASEIMYTPMRPLPNMPIFGYPGTLQIFIEASEAIRKTNYQVNFWDQGTIPDMIVTVPDTWTPRHIAMFQAHFDALLSGNLNLKSKVRFLPGGMKPYDIKNSSGESLWSQRDETLIRLACYAYSVSPTPFVKQTNRSVAQNAQQTAEEEGLYPLMSYWADDIMNTIIQEKHGYDEVEFTYLPRPEPDQEKATKIHDMKIKNGELSINEARDEDGLEPIPGGDVHLVYIGNAVIPLEDAAAGKAMPVQGGTGTSADGGAGSSSSSKPVKPVSGQPQRGANVPSHRPAVVKSLVQVLEKVSPEELRVAAREAKGHDESLSPRQVAVGNYPKGHVWIQGLNISIEHQKNTVRAKRELDGTTSWEATMPTHYGYIRGTLGADDDHIDVYVGKYPDSKTVWIVDQNRVSKKKGKIKGFDEHKVGIGYRNAKRFIKDYLKSHAGNNGPAHLGPVTELSMKEFKAWLTTGNTQEPASGQGFGTVMEPGDLGKLDTISTATNLSWRDNGPKTRSKKKKKRLSRGPQWLTLGTA